MHNLQMVLPHLKDWLEWFSAINLYLRDNFGTFALITFYLLLVYFVIMLLVKVLKAALNLVFYILLPSFALSFLASFLVSYPFFNILPFFICLLLGINLFKVLR
jgi:hypothetical protein